MTPRCWAFNRNRERCDLPPGHDGDHEIRVAWSDDDCWTPTPQPTPPPPSPAAPVTHNEPPSGHCFACGCSEADHGKQGCSRHQCKTFVP